MGNRTYRGTPSNRNDSNYGVKTSGHWDIGSCHDS